MASCCCAAVLNPGLLGQLILATVAIQAALNSVAALGPCCTGAVSCFGSVFFVPAQPCPKKRLEIQAMSKNILLYIYQFWTLHSKYGKYATKNSIILHFNTVSAFFTLFKY
jgi:hypothetical protein